jgi:UDP-glucose 4-epimerase
MNVLITGGAGYIGSHAVKMFIAAGHNVVVIDNLSTGFIHSVDEKAIFYNIDIRDFKKVKDVLISNEIEIVIHFAAFSLVAQSMEIPLAYYNNNVYGTMVLLDAMKESNVKKIVFSSSAAVYGEQSIMPITENANVLPTNAYGATKLAMEKMMRWADISHGIKYISLRYFNVAGAHYSGTIGENHNPETHLIPLVLQVPQGKRTHIDVYGNDYDTSDGTCVRDYIHIEDLIEAHMLAMKQLFKVNKSNIYNLGSGQGFSVLEIIKAARKITNSDIRIVQSKRRDGDPAKLIASSEKAEKELGWVRKFNDISSIISSAWKYHQFHKEGYSNEDK